VDTRTIQDFVERKTREAARVDLETLSTLLQRRDVGVLHGIGNAWNARPSRR